MSQARWEHCEDADVGTYQLLQQSTVFSVRCREVGDNVVELLQGVPCGESRRGVLVALAPRQQPDLAGQSSSGKQDQRTSSRTRNITRGGARQ